MSPAALTGPSREARAGSTRAGSPSTVRSRLSRALSGLLSEAVMGFLALVAGALALVPICFDTSASTEELLDVFQWLIVGVFAVEYAAGLLRAPSKRAYVLDPWRILDLFIILAPLVSLLPSVAGELRSSPALRLLRLSRVAVLGARVGGVMVREQAHRARVLPRGPVEVSVLRRAGKTTPEPASWQEFVQWVKEPGEDWYHASNLGAEHLAEVAATAGVPRAFLESYLLESGYPRLEVFERFSALFVWLPSVAAGEDLPAHGDRAYPSQRPRSDVRIHRNGLLLLASPKTLFTLSQHSINLQASVAGAFTRIHVPEASFAARIVLAFLRVVTDRNDELVGLFERELALLEEVPVRESRPDFLERTFLLKKELSAAKNDLWRLKELLSALSRSQAIFPGLCTEPCSLFLEALARDADYLYETVVNVREELLSLLDLHLNVVSFEMNRVMRVLAVVSVLGLIPAVVGGLLGMNLADSPWQITLPQIAFGVLTGMIFCFYFFFVKGWLR